MCVIYYVECVCCTPWPMSTFLWNNKGPLEPVLTGSATAIDKRPSQLMTSNISIYIIICINNYMYIYISISIYIYHYIYIYIIIYIYMYHETAYMSSTWSILTHHFFTCPTLKISSDLDPVAPKRQRSFKRAVQVCVSGRPGPIFFKDPMSILMGIDMYR